MLRDSLTPANVESPAAARASVKALLQSWSPKLLQIIDATNGPMIPRPIVVLPNDHQWPESSK